MVVAFTDIDGVLLGLAPDRRTPAVADGAHELLRFALDDFDELRWLTTHGREGRTEPVMQYLRQFVGDGLMELAARVPAAQWTTMKTEAFEGEDDFVWIDDQPLWSEREWLRVRGMEDRLIAVDTRRRPRDLLRALDVLRTRFGRG